MPFNIFGANSVSGYTVKNSLRFNAGSSDYLNRTPSSAGNRQKWTYSCWVKKVKNDSVEPGNYPALLTAGSDGTEFYFLQDTGQLSFYNYTTSYVANVRTSAYFRDISAWYHIVLSVDTTQATDTNRIKIYVNNTLQTLTSTTYPPQNTQMDINNNVGHYIGRYSASGSYPPRWGNYYLSEAYLIDGQQLDPSSFGETDLLTGIWKPKAYTGTYGTNGFYLKFANSASLGTDSSGNGNNFTVNNLTSVDQTTDTPTNNYCTINGAEGITKTLTDGNLSLTGSYKSPRGTIGFSKGKWYWECKLITQITAEQVVGICGETFNPANTIGGDNNSWGYIIQSNANNGQVYHNGSTTQYATFTANDILNIAVDMDNQAIYFGKNGTWQNSGVPTSGSSKTGAIYTNLPTSGFVFPAFDNGTGTSGLISANFGNPPYSSNAYTDGAGYGNFSYSVPSGYYSLCTKNLADFG